MSKTKEEQARELSLDEAEILALESDYAVFANEDVETINKADAAAFFLEGYKHALSIKDKEIAELKEQLKKGIELFYEHEDGYVFQNVHEWQQVAHKLIEEKAREPYLQELFNHMSNEHGLTLLQNEMQEIISICSSIEDKEIDNLQYELSEIEHQNRKYEEQLRWISISEKLNPSLLQIITINKKGLCNICSYSPMWKCWDSYIESATHWLPIPKEERKESSVVK